jgi:hypothetical protein
MIRHGVRQPVRQYVAGQSDPIDTLALVFEIEANPDQEPFSGEYKLNMEKYRLGFATR